MNIDDLLKIVDPKLVAGYEKNNLNGKTLHEVNEEYKAVTQQTGMSFDDCLKLILFSLVIGFLLYFYLWYKGVPVYVSAIAMVALVLPIELYLLFPVRWKFENDRATRYRCGPILRDFRQAVEALDPLGVMGHNERHNNSSIGYTLGKLASTLIEAETSFKDMRMKENSPTEDVVRSGNFEVKCRHQLEETIDCAMKFGTIYKKHNLIVEEKTRKTLLEEDIKRLRGY